MPSKPLFAIKTMSTPHGTAAFGRMATERARLSPALLQRGTLDRRMHAAGWAIVPKDVFRHSPDAADRKLPAAMTVSERRSKLETALRLLSKSLIDEDLALAVGQIRLIAKARRRTVMSRSAGETISAA